MTTLIQDEQKRQKIMARMREHLVPVLEHCRGGWVGLFLQGSQNYNLDYEGSDIDTKAIMLPSFSDFVLNAKPLSTTHIMENNEHVDFKDIRLKLRFESQFQKLSPGGAISYIEVANLSDNIPAVLTVLKYIYDNIMYAELNTKSDYCQVCGWDKEIEIVDDDRGKLIWKCPNCGNTDKSKMNIARRTCGYIGLNDWNQGRTQEIKERYVHLGGDE